MSCGDANVAEHADQPLGFDVSALPRGFVRAESPVRPISSSVRAALTTPSASKLAAAPLSPWAARRSDFAVARVERLADLSPDAAAHRRRTGG